MNKIIISLLLFAPLARAQSLTLDFRPDAQNPPIARDALSAKEQQRLFKAVYPKADANGCREELQGEMAAVRGHFSSTSQEQILVAFASSPCGIHANYHGNLLLLSADKRRVTQWLNVSDSDNIELVADLDGDGLLDAVTSITDGNQGEFRTHVFTFTFKGGTIDILSMPVGIMGKAQQLSCADTDIGTYDYRAVYSFEPGATVQKNYRTSCASGETTLYSTGPLWVDSDGDGVEDDDGG